MDSIEAKTMPTLDFKGKQRIREIKPARKPETRAARVSKTAELAAENRMANHPAGRDRGPV